MAKIITEEQKRKAIEIYFQNTEDRSTRMLDEPDKVEQFLRELESKLSQLPVVGNALSSVPLLISLVRSYIKKDYTKIPIGSVAAIIGALTYVLAPIDLIPDFVPGIGYADDIAVVGACLQLVKSDLDDYKLWRNEESE